MTNISHYPLDLLKMLVEDSEKTLSRFQFNFMINFGAIKLFLIFLQRENTATNLSHYPPALRCYLKLVKKRHKIKVWDKLSYIILILSEIVAMHLPQIFKSVVISNMNLKFLVFNTFPRWRSQLNKWKVYNSVS